MPLSEPAPREALHTRAIDCRGYEREDGLWDIEGRLNDVKSYAISNQWRGEIPPGEPIHDMLVRLTIDDEFVVQAVETASDGAPYAMCGDIAPNFQTLVGVKVAPGWHRKIKERVGGVRGCAHIVELIGILGTVAYQTIYSRRKAWDSKRIDRPFLLNTCHAWAADGPMIEKHYPDWYEGD